MVGDHLTAVRWPRVACERGRRGEGRVGIEDPLSDLTLFGGGTPLHLTYMKSVVSVSDDVVLSDRHVANKLQQFISVR